MPKHGKNDRLILFLPPRSICRTNTANASVRTSKNAAELFDFENSRSAFAERHVRYHYSTPQENVNLFARPYGGFLRRPIHVPTFTTTIIIRKVNIVKAVLQILSTKFANPLKKIYICVILYTSECAVSVTYCLDGTLAAISKGDEA